MAEQKLYLNIQEQVEKNKNDIKFMLEEEGTLNKFGIKVIGQEDDVSDMPSVADYKEDNEDWAYGDAYAIGTEPPYTLYVLTRANGTHPNDYWFNIGQFPVPGPQGETGEQGPAGHTPQVTVASNIPVTMLPPGSNGHGSVSNIGTADDPQLAFSFDIPKGDKGDTGSPGRPGAFHINGQVASAALLPDASLVDADAAYAVGSVLPYDVYVIMTVEGVQSWLNLGPVLTEISDTYELNISGTSGSLTQEQVDALVNDTNMNFIKIGDYFYFKTDVQGTLIEYTTIFSGKYITTFIVNTVNNQFSYGSPVTVVDIQSAQTITGAKTFSNGVITSEVKPSSGTLTLGLSGQGVQTNGPLYPVANGTRDLGNSNRQWKDGYFAGQVYAQNTFNVINATDIVNNTLTQDQYDLITNGKPTLIQGELFTGINSIKLMSYLETTNELRFCGFYNANVCAITVNKSTKVIALLGASSTVLSLRSIDSFNGKSIPPYPSSTGTFVLKCVDGVLTWVAE